MQYIICGIILATIFGIYLEARRRVAKHRQAIVEEKSEIADETRMTAQLSVFSGPDDATYLIAASEEMGAFYYRLINKGKVLSRIKLNLAHIHSVALLVNNTPQDIDVESSQVTSSNRATEMTSLVLSYFPPEIVRSIVTIELRLSYTSESGEERDLNLLLLNTQDPHQKTSRIKVLKNAIWWWEFLRMLTRSAYQTQAIIEGTPNL